MAYLYAAYRGNFNIGLWNKTFIVGSIMAILKGIFDVVTILPDSTGWKSCKERLGKEGIASFREMSFVADFDGAFLKLLTLEILGGQGGRRVRYCADMMISGHTYFAALFSLSAYKQIYYSGSGKMVARLVGFTCLCCISTELILVAAARFHYTVDMLAALVLVVLLFDSTYVEQLAADWSEGFRWRDKETFQMHLSPVFNLYMRIRYQPTSVLRSGVQSKPETDALIQKQSGEHEQPIVPSRPVGLLNPRVTSGSPPWSWQHLDEALVQEAADEDFCMDDVEIGDTTDGSSLTPVHQEGSKGKCASSVEDGQGQCSLPPRRGALKMALGLVLGCLS